MKRYTLTSAARPRISKGQADIFYKCLEPYGSSHTLEQLIAEATTRKLQSLFKRPDSTTVRESLNYHLNRFVKAGYARIAEDSSFQRE